MASFKCILAIVLVAACQVAQISAAPAPAPATSLPLCTERPETGDNDRGYSLGYFHQDTAASNGQRFVAVFDRDAIVQVEQSQVTQKYITTIQTGDIGLTNSLIGVVWTLSGPDDRGKMYTTRYFKLKPHQKCRVQHSAQYAKLEGASYV